MSGSGSMLRERLKARREKAKEGSLLRESSLDGPQATGKEDEESVDTLLNKDQDGIEAEDEAKESEQLIQTLKKKRRRMQKELSHIQPSEDEDISEQMRTAKQKTRQRFLDETVRSATEGEETAASEDTYDPIPILPEERVRKESTDTLDGEIGRPLSARTPRDTTPRGQESGSTPRRASKTIGTSYRAKLQAKMRAAKDKGKDEAYDETRVSGRRLAGMRGLSRPTRFDDVPKDDIDEDFLQKSLSVRSKWKDAATKATGKSLWPTEEEAYDFFTRQWDPEESELDGGPKQATPREAEPSEAPPTAESGEAAAAESEQPATEPTGEDEEQEDAKKKKEKKAKSEEEEPLINDIDEAEDSWKYYQVGRAEYKPFHEKMEAEEKLFFYPSVRPAKAEERLFDADAPRYLEEEGFYVGRRPIVPSKNLHKMENRLLNEPGQNQSWFGEDGVLLALPDPLKEISYRPPIVEEIEPELQTEYKKAYLAELDGRYIDPSGEAGQAGHYQLDVDVNTITFTHHHLFSREHVLATRITNQYQQYLSRSKKKAAEFLNEKLKALKAAAQHVQDNIADMKSQKKSEAGIELQQQRLQEYQEEIKLTRKQRDAEMGADRSLMKHIIQTWKDIKSLRQFQKYINTSIKLTIKKEPSNKVHDEEEWEQDIQDELQEYRTEAEAEYEQSLAAYRKQLDEWKKQKLEKKEAQKRQKKRDRRQSRGNETEEELEQAEKDHDILEAENIEKPEKPKPINEEELRQKIIDKYNDIRRKPGEPKIYFELSNGASVTPNNQCPRGEQARRNEVNRCKVYVKVLFNGKEVSRTPAKPVGTDFTVRFAQIFNIEIMQWPESIKMEVYETFGLSSLLLSEVYAAIPESNITAENVHLEELEFSSDQKVSHTHEGVGSNVPFSFDKDRVNMLSLLTSGIFCTSASWAVDEVGNILVPPNALSAHKMYGAMKMMDAVAAIGVAGMSDMDKLTKWIADSHLDPNDPSNAELMYLMRPVGGGDAMVSTLRMPEHFRLEQLQQEFNLATDEEIENSRRFRLIQLREQEIPEFKNKVIPALEKEVPEDVFMDYEKKRREEEKLKKLDESESHRVAVAKFMQRVREQVMLRFRIASHQKTLSEMVFEDAVPNIGTIIPNLVKMTEPRRPLKPIRKERKKVTAQNLQAMDVKVLVNVVRAFGIPVRADTSGGAAEPGLSPRPPEGVVPGPAPATSIPGRGIRNITETQVRPYIEVMFQRHTVATSVADGPNPSWNEELAIPFKPPNNDYSSTNLQTIRDILYFNLFDEYVTDVVQDDRERGTTVLRRIEKRWLGSIKIPFSTVYFNARIDGTFRLRKPPVLLGYQHEMRQRRGEDTVDFGIGTGEDTYLTMFVTIEPALSPAEPAKERFDSNEDEKLLELAEKWQAELSGKFPKREYKTTVVDINGKFVFITRYFKGLRPPENLVEEGSTPQQHAEAVARYVSLIPFVSDSVVFPGLCDIWSTCDQFLQMLQGDEEEHAVLLTNYFLSMGKTTFLLLGSAIPEGPTAYVLTKEEGDYWVWNASTAEHFSYRDSYCPVQSVGSLVTPDNIYANVQPNDQPSRITFDISNTSHWKPFFHKGCPNPGLSSVQPESLIYIPTDKTVVVDIQEKIERHLKEKIMEWRPRHITRWNRYCVQSFRKLLTRLEGNRGRGIQQQHSAELEQILGQYKMCGFPINLPYTEMEPIVDSVFATGVHNVESSDVEFALAVHVHPYPNSVLSVWIYVASLIRKR